MSTATWCTIVSSHARTGAPAGSKVAQDRQARTSASWAASSASAGSPRTRRARAISRWRYAASAARRPASVHRPAHPSGRHDAGWRSVSVSMSVSVCAGRPRPHRQRLPIRVLPTAHPVRDDVPVAGLLERQVQLQLLEAAVGRAAAGRGSTVLVLGEAGIGKTSLLRAFLAGAAPTVRVLTGACEDLLTPRPLSPLREAVQSVPGPLYDALSAPPDDPGEVFAAAAQELAREPGPTVLVVEDAHWADGATLDALRFLGRRMHELPAVLVVSYREDELDLDHPLRSVLGGLASVEALRLRLERLTPAARGLLAGQHGFDADELFRLTGGNPFFVSELLAFSGPAVPPTVVDAVLARFASLGPESQAVVRQLSVVPAGLGLATLRELVDDLEPVGEAERAGVLEVRGTLVSFRHELARRAVEGSLASIERIELNRVMLQLLVDEQGRSGADPFRMLHHAVGAGDDRAVVEHGTTAARQATRVGAHQQAAVAYEQVLARGALLDATSRGRLREGYAWSLSNTNRLDAAAGEAAAAVREYESAGDRPRLVRPLVTLSRQQ